MSETTKPDLSGVPATSLITLYIRSVESQRPDALIKDERAEEAQLVFEAYLPFLMWSHKLRVTCKRIGAHLHWALKDPRDLEGWRDGTTVSRRPSGDGIRLLDERFPFQYPEPRIRNALKIRLVPFLGKGIGVFRY